MTGSLTAFGESAVAQFTPLTGWSFAYDINADMVTTTTSGGTVTHSDNHAVLSTGAAADQSAKIETVRAMRYIPGQGGKVRFTAKFTQGVAGSRQIIGIGDDNDGFFFGFDGATFGIMRRSGGEDDWTPVSQWNESRDPWETYFNPELGNVYQITWQWLGYGAVSFWMEETGSGEFQLMHIIRYANRNTSTSIKNPTLPLMAEVKNTTNETDIVLETPSAIAGLDGIVYGPEPIHPFSFFRTATASKSGITTEAAVLSLKNATTFQSITNRVRMRLAALSLATDGAQSAIVYIRKGVTLGGSPSYTDYNANTSVGSYDTAGTTVTGGTLITTLALAKIDSRTIDMAPFGVELAPGETITISATSPVSTAVAVAATWVDLF